MFKFFIVFISNFLKFCDYSHKFYDSVFYSFSHKFYFFSHRFLDVDLMAILLIFQNVYVVPAFTGLGAPYWDGDARGIITGITRGTTKEHLIRATMEGIAYQVYDVLKAMENDLNIDIKSLSVDGGACKNNFLMQFEADILKAEVRRPKVVEVTALGAAYLAGLQTGYWKNLNEIIENKEIEKTFNPTMPDEIRCAKLKGWHKAVKLALIHDED